MAGESGRGDASMIYSTGIGFQDVWYEGWPLYEKGNNDQEWILRPGTFLSVFSGMEQAGQYMILCVDPVVITGTGYELLTRIDRSQLRVVGRNLLDDPRNVAPVHADDRSRCAYSYVLAPDPTWTIQSRKARSGG